MNIYFIIILLIIILDYLLELIIEILNLNNWSPKLPDEFHGVYDEDRYTKSQLYLKENTYINLIQMTVLNIIIILLIIYGGFNIIDKFSRGFGFNSILTGIIFAVILGIGSFIIQIPFSIYDTFVIEERYGFNKTTIKTFILDIVKGIVLVVVFGGPFLYVLLWFFEKFNKTAWIYCWLFAVGYECIILYIAPVIIMPLFNKFVPIEDEELKERIQSYAYKQNFKLSGIFRMDGSKRSTKANAMFTGFGRFRRVILFDTLIEKYSTDEIISILAHEIGHYKLRHIIKNLIISIINSGIIFYLLSIFLNNKSMFSAFRIENTSVYGSLLIFGFLYSPIDRILSLVLNKISRKFEYAADMYSIKTTEHPEALVTGLKKISADSMSNLTPHKLKVIFSYSHPPILERVKYIKDNLKKV